MKDAFLSRDALGVELPGGQGKGVRKMLWVQEQPKRLEFRLSAELSCITQVLQRAAIFLQRYGAREQRSSAILMREMLRNAIIHGSQHDASKEVLLSLQCLSRGSFRLQVVDEGEGFAYEGLELHTPEDPRVLKERGLILINHLATRLEFRRGGRSVCAFLNLQQTPHQALGSVVSGRFC